MTKPAPAPEAPAVPLPKYQCWRVRGTLQHRPNTPNVELVDFDKGWCYSHRPEDKPFVRIIPHAREFRDVMALSTESMEAAEEAFWEQCAKLGYHRSETDV